MKFLACLTLLFISNLALYSQPFSLGGEITREKVSELDSFIRKYAPSDSSLKALNTWAFRLNLAGRAVVARLLYKTYAPLYANQGEFFDRQIDYFAELMLAQVPEQSTRVFYDAYIQEEAPSDRAFVAVKRMAAEFIANKEWDSAAKVFTVYKSLFPQSIDKFEKIIKLLEADSEDLVAENLGSEINSPRDEWDPNPTNDGRYIYFSAMQRPGGKGRQDVWMSEKDGNKWKKAINLGKSINSSKDETVDNVTADGTGLFLSGTFEGTFGNFDIYFAELSDKGWGKLQHFPMPINSKYQDEAANMSADGKAIIFCSDRPGGIGPYKPFGALYNGSSNGNEDIYITFKTDSGWSRPVNLGANINTPFSERSPYLHPDGRTLYFSSEGHYGLGGLDVFVSRRLKDDSWTEWSEPINLGKEINSVNDDFGYKIDVFGDNAFFAARNRDDGYGGLDLYKIKIPREAKPENVIVIKGFVRDVAGKPLAAEIIWEDLSSGEEIGVLKSNPITGAYTITLPIGKNYGYYASLKGYYPASRNINLNSIKGEPEFVEDITLISESDFRSGKVKVIINNVFFDFDKHILNRESYPELNRLATFLNLPANKTMYLEIEGHTDIVGTEEYNQKLSEQRADAVKSYLASKGIATERMRTKGYGSSVPLESNDTDKGRAVNRRVVIWCVREK